MKTNKPNTPKETNFQKAFRHFLEAAGIRHGWTPYSNDTLRAQMAEGRKPRHRVFAWLILNSWGLSNKSVFAMYGNRPARFVDVATDLQLDERHVRKLVLDLERRGWLRIVDDKSPMLICPKGDPEIPGTPEIHEEEDWEYRAREHFLFREHPELIEFREAAHALWNEYRKVERAAFSYFETKLKGMSDAQKDELLQHAKNTPVPTPDPVVLEYKFDGTENRILTALITKKTSLSRVADLKTPEARPERDAQPVGATEEQGVSPSPLARLSDPKPAIRQSASSAPLNRPAAATPRQYALVIEALNDFGVGDEATAKTLLRKCWEFSPDAAVEEIVKVIHHKGEDAINRKIKNQIGFLMTYVPPACPEAIKKLRKFYAKE